MRIRLTAAALLIAAGAGAQTPPKPPVPVPQPRPAPSATAATPIAPPPATPAPAIPATAVARELFGSKAQPAPLQARSIGFYSHGCLAGAVALPVDGKTWQVMRLSRNRNWGHPNLIAFLERFSAKLPQI